MSAKYCRKWIPSLIFIGIALILIRWFKQNGSHEQRKPSMNAKNGEMHSNASISKVILSHSRTPSIAINADELILNVETVGTVVFHFDRFSLEGHELPSVGDQCVVVMDKNRRVTAVNILNKNLEIIPLPLDQVKDVSPDPFAPLPQDK